MPASLTSTGSSISKAASTTSSCAARGTLTRRDRGDAAVTPGRGEAAVVGVPDPEWGKPSPPLSCSPKASRRPRPSCRTGCARLRSTKTPQLIGFYDEMPYNETGKLLRVLRTDLAAAEEEQAPEGRWSASWRWSCASRLLRCLLRRLPASEEIEVVERRVEHSQQIFRHLAVTVGGSAKRSATCAAPRPTPRSCR